jgi:hypothetical protein
VRGVLLPSILTGSDCAHVADDESAGVPDLDALLDAAAEGPSRRCKYRDILAGLTDAQTERLEQLPATVAANVLTDAGMPVSDDVIRRHRKHTCG